ncbi:MAG: hypothetical protein Kow0010_25320 [Dehalococcoidia bacterium]
MAPPTILVPVNRLAEAKERLAPLLDDAERAELARITMETVVEAAGDVGKVVVLTNDPAVQRAVAGRAAILVERPALRGLNAQLEAALATLVDGGATEVLVLHADLPLATAGALRRLVEAAPVAPSVTIARPPDGGTNAMLLRPPGRFRLAYGKGSCDRHAAAAREAGMAVRLVEPPELTLDLDTPGDVRRLLEGDAGRASRAGRYLRAIGVETRPAFATTG